MPFELSKYAKGLPSLLGLKQRGIGIPYLADSAVGIIDVRDLYLLNDRELVPFTSVAAAVVGPNDFPGAVVPAGEEWYVWYLQCGAQPGAGASITIAPAMHLDGATNATTIGDYLSVAANENAQAVTRTPFWAGPGTTFSVYVKNIVLANAVSGAALITRLRV
jgi:hypothetical protein